MSPKKKTASFQSLRVLGEKAQRMIEKAKKVNDAEKKQKNAPLPKKKECEQIVAHISVSSVTKAAFAILFIIIGTYILLSIRDKVILVLLAMFLAAAIDPGVHAMERWGIPRGLGVLIQYFVALFLVFFLIASLIPIIAKQIQEIALLLSVKVDTFLESPQIDLPLLSDQVNQQLTVFVQTTLQNLEIDRFTQVLQQISKQLSSSASQSVIFAASVAGSVFKFFASMFVVMVLAFFMQLEKENILRWSVGFFPQKYRMYLNGKTEAMHTKIGQWARGQLMLCFSIFLLTLIALFILDMDYALTLAALAGFCEFVPAVGPFIAAVPAVLIAATKGGVVWMLVLAGVYYVIQWCENNLLVPLIMKRAVGLSPIAILTAMMVGISFPETIHPVLGVMLAVPTTTILSLFLEDWRKHEK